MFTQSSHQAYFFFLLKAVKSGFLQGTLVNLVGTRGFPGGSDGKESTCNAGDLGSIPGLGRSPAGGHGNPLQ